VPGVAIDLTGHTALVTGGTRNIGRAIAVLLARAGATIAIIGRHDQGALDETLEEIRALGGRAMGILVDVSDWDALAAALGRIDEAVGTCDIVVNNVGIRPPVPLADLTAADWDAVLGVNVRAAFQTIQWALPHMMARNWGRVVNVSGLDAVAGSYGRIHVTTSKGAVLGLTAAVAPGCARHGVTVNTLVPGATDTERHTPEWYADLDKQAQTADGRTIVGRLAQIDEIASVALFLASPLASYVTGQSLYVGGGYPLVRRPEREAAYAIEPRLGHAGPS
jgi:3-oxoacyl-[acyl-carrier protein] reductase